MTLNIVHCEDNKGKEASAFMKIEISSAGLKLKALLDTRASCSLLDYNVYLLMKEKYPAIKFDRIKNEYLRIQTADGKLMKSQGVL